MNHAWDGRKQEMSVYNLVDCVQDGKKKLSILTAIFRTLPSLNFQDQGGIKHSEKCRIVNIKAGFTYD